MRDPPSPTRVPGAQICAAEDAEDVPISRCPQKLRRVLLRAHLLPVAYAYLGIATPRTMDV